MGQAFDVHGRVGHFTQQRFEVQFGDVAGNGCPCQAQLNFAQSVYVIVVKLTFNASHFTLIGDGRGVHGHIVGARGVESLPVVPGMEHGHGGQVIGLARPGVGTVVASGLAVFGAIGQHTNHFCACQR